MKVKFWRGGLGVGLLACALAALVAGVALGAEGETARAAQPAIAPAAPARPAAYVGADACKECHESQYQSYRSNSKKAHSYNSVKRMGHALNEAELRKCYECHTTGYGKPGGFVSEQQTPRMAEAGCEVCHGPGGKHVQSQDKHDIKGKLKPEDCTGCHNAERVQAFNFRPLIYSGGH